MQTGKKKTRETNKISFILFKIFQCSKTFMDRLSLIHHFVDHFPNIFYSFEERQVPIQQQESRNPPPTPNPSPMGPAAANERGQFPMNGMGKSHLLSGNGNIGMNGGGEGGGGDGQKQPPQSQVPTNELLGQLATFFGKEPSEFFLNYA
jgi:hypothetical protein